MPRVPETIAIDTIIGALQALPDQAARDRVMAFVNAYRLPDLAVENAIRPNGQIELASHNSAQNNAPGD